jgi:hypothetical protein
MGNTSSPLNWLPTFSWLSLIVGMSFSAWIRAQASGQARWSHFILVSPLTLSIIATRKATDYDKIEYHPFCGGSVHIEVPAYVVSSADHGQNTGQVCNLCSILCLVKWGPNREKFPWVWETGICSITIPGIVKQMMVDTDERWWAS